MTVTAEINIESPAGRRLLKVLEKHSNIVKINYHTPQESKDYAEKTHSFDEFEQNLFKEFEKRYGVDIKDV